MRINKKHEFVFISTPKAGTHTIYKLLEEHFSDGLLKAGFHNNRITNGYHHFFRWTVVRNPFSRAVSIWWSACRLAHKDQYRFRERCGAKDDFDKFIKWFTRVSNKDKQREPLLQNQSEWLEPLGDSLYALHLEHLKKDLENLHFWKKGIEIPKLNTTNEKIEVQSKEEGKTIVRPSMKELYKNSATVDAVIKWAGDDFKRFGYEKD